MPDCDKNQNGSEYQIIIQGKLNADWPTWFSGMDVSHQDDPLFTILSGPISNRAKLRGILNKLWELNTIIISVYQFYVDRFYHHSNLAEGRFANQCNPKRGGSDHPHLTIEKYLSSSQDYS